MSVIIQTYMQSCLNLNYTVYMWKNQFKMDLNLRDLLLIDCLVCFNIIPQNCKDLADLL